MTTPYRPSNATEGDIFYAANCQLCRHGQGMAEGDDDYCDIYADSMMFDIDSPDYPREWVIGLSGPCCTAFRALDDGRPPRCPNTPDMFGGAA